MSSVARRLSSSAKKATGATTDDRRGSRHHHHREGDATETLKTKPGPLAEKDKNTLVSRPRKQPGTPVAAVKTETTERRGSRATNDSAAHQKRQGQEQRQERKPDAAEEKAKEKAQHTTSVASHAQSHGPAKGRYVTIKARVKRNHRKTINDTIKSEKRRDVVFKKFARSRNALRTSFIPNNDDDNSEDVPAASPDYMNFLNLEAFGNDVRMYTEVSFGENPESAPIEVVIDTGSAVTWVNKTSYEAALASTGARAAPPQQDMLFKMGYQGGDVEGDVVVDKMTLCGIETRKVTLTFAFGVVDEDKFPDAKRWRTQQDVCGILGIGDRRLARGAARKLKEGEWKKLTLPTIMDKLMESGYISDNIVGIRYGLPDEGNRQPDDAASQSSGSQAGTMGAHFHLGGFSTSSHKPETLRWIPVTTVGSAARFSGVDLELKYGSTIVMAESPGIVDSGADMISLPGAVLDAWLAAANEGGQIVRYDAQAEIYHMKKEDFGKLKPLEFNFKKGTDAVFKLEPRQQVYPPSLKRKEVAEDTKGDHLYFVFRRLSDADGGDRKFNLGEWWSKYIPIMLKKLKAGAYMTISQ